MALTLAPIDTSVDNFNTLFQRVNQIIETLDTRIVTVGPTTPDLSIGNFNIDGNIGAVNASFNGIRSSTIDNVTGVSAPVYVNSQIEFRSGNRITARNYHVSGPKNAFATSNITWEAGVENNSSNSDFLFVVAGQTNGIRLTTDGKIKASSFEGSEAKIQSLTSTNGINIFATNGVTIDSNLTVTENTSFSGPVTTTNTFNAARMSLGGAAGTTVLTATGDVAFSETTTMNKMNVSGTASFTGGVSFTGNAAFANTISGNISGNAATASSVNWDNVTNKPTTLADYGIVNAISSASTQPRNIWIYNELPSLNFHNNSAIDATFQIRGATDGSLSILSKIGSSNALVERLRIRSDNGVTQFNNSIDISGIVLARSDIRLKSNIVKISNALEKITALNGYFYDMYGKRSIGVIAQELQNVVPEMVEEGEDGILSVAYGNGLGLIIEAVKELKERVDEIAKNI